RPMKVWALGFGALLSSACGALFLTQCGDSNFGTPQDGGSGGDAAAQCPANPPTTGTACSLPTGTLCNAYPQPGCECCGSGGFECDNGTWQALAESDGPNITAACPVTVPEAGTPCSLATCGGPLPACPYDCTTGNGAISTASCPQGYWVVQQSEVSCLIDGGAPDAGDGDGG
ncbi:MAG: hypothetical protein ABI183_02310, partial [Polyangiaceae bacterium]